MKEVFVGYCKETKAYRIFVPDTGKVIVSIDVKFVENEVWQRSSNKASIQKIVLQVGMTIIPKPDPSLTGKIRFDQVSGLVQVKPDLYEMGTSASMRILIPDPYSNPNPTRN